MSRVLKSPLTKDKLKLNINEKNKKIKTKSMEEKRIKEEK